MDVQTWYEFTNTKSGKVSSIRDIQSEIAIDLAMCNISPSKSSEVFDVIVKIGILGETPVDYNEFKGSSSMDLFGDETVFSFITSKYINGKFTFSTANVRVLLAV